MNWTAVQLPYLRPPQDLPVPLPCELDIFNSSEIFNPDSHRTVVGVGKHFVVKYGPGIDEREGQNLLFLERQLGGSSFVPKLYAMYRFLATKHLCLIMERIPGESLEKLWPSLNETEKSRICVKARAILITVRQTPAPGFYGSVDGGPVPHYFLWSGEKDSLIHGPFQSEQELNMGFVKKLRDIWAMNKKHSFKADFYERQLGNALKDHSPVFTHTDIQKKNIIVDRIIADDDFRVSIVDWESAGWYPSYWEYAAMFAALEWTGDWPMWFGKIVEPWIDEAAIMRMISQDLFY